MDRRGFLGFFLFGGLFSFIRRSTLFRAVEGPPRPRRAMFWRSVNDGAGEGDA